MSFRRITTLALVLGAVSCATVPDFRFSYQNPEETAAIGQFYSGPDNAFIYNWGYQFPGRAHSESKDNAGTVRGSYAFVDANGKVQQVEYRSASGVGFTADQRVVADSQFPNLFRREEIGSEWEREPLTAFRAQDVNQIRDNLFRTLIDDERSLSSDHSEAVEIASPTLLAAVRSGHLVPIRENQGEVVFRVDNELIDEAKGSVSALAAILDADPVAARHDQQIFRGPGTFYSASQAEPSAERAVLDTEFLDTGSPGYVIRVPIVGE